MKSLVDGAPRRLPKEIGQVNLSQHKNCYDFCMYVRPLQLLAIVCVARVCLAQAPVPSNTYTIHAQKERRAGFSLVPTVALPSTMLVATPDNALLVLIPQTEGEWALKRLSEWDTSHPQEQTLTIKGNPHSNKDVSVATDMILDPHGAYLLLRIDSRLGAIDSPNRIREAVVNVIDLHSFTIISRRITTDPLLASSQWRFSKDDQLISKGIATRSSAKTPSVNTVTDAYDAAALTLPDLAPTTSCHYDQVIELRADSSGWTKPTVKNVGDGCAALLRSAAVSSLEDLPGHDEEMPKDLSKLAAPDCLIQSVNREKTLAVLECRTGHSYMDGEIVTTRSRGITVLSIQDGKPVFSLPLPHNWKPIPGVVAFANGKNNLILLRDGVKLKTYPLK
jgi:hypothetical protein